MRRLAAAGLVCAAGRGASGNLARVRRDRMLTCLRTTGWVSRCHQASSASSAGWSAHRPELNTGRCPARADQQIRAVMTITLDDPDDGGEFAAELMREAAEGSGVMGRIPLR